MITDQEVLAVCTTLPALSLAALRDSLDRHHSVSLTVSRPTDLLLFVVSHWLVVAWSLQLGCKLPKELGAQM
jgi:hypothetical protein